MVKELLGGHVQIVDTLLARLSALQAADTNSPRVVVLRGASGTGKSRIIQELYERLRAKSAYWPASLESEDDSNPLTDRKWISPDVDNLTWPSGALPEFGWWGFNCDLLGNGRFQNVVDTARPQLDAHVLPLTLARQQKASWSDKAKAVSPTAAREIRAASLNEAEGVAADLLMEVTGTVIPFAGTLIKWGVKGVKASRQRASERELLQMEVDQGYFKNETVKSAGRDLAEVIFSLAHRDLPAVVAIEDMHQMGPDLVAMVEALAERSDQPVLIIGTAWPEGQANPNNHHYRTWLQSHEGQETVEIIEVPLLESEDLEKLLRSYAPETAEDDARHIVSKISNPLWLKMWLNTENMEFHITRQGVPGAIELASGVKIPAEFEEVIGDRWEQLGPHLQLAMMYANSANPVDPLEDAVGRFIPEIIAKVIEDYITEFPGRSNRNPSDITDALADAVDPAAWCRMERATQFFTESQLAKHARKQSNKELGGRDKISPPAAHS